MPRRPRLLPRRGALFHPLRLQAVLFSTLAAERGAHYDTINSFDAVKSTAAQSFRHTRLCDVHTCLASMQLTRMHRAQVVHLKLQYFVYT